MPAALQRAASGLQPGRPTGPSESDKVFPGHEDGAATSVRFRRDSRWRLSGRLVEVRASALVSGARNAQAPAQLTSRESRLGAVGRDDRAADGCGEVAGEEGEDVSYRFRPGAAGPEVGAAERHVGGLPAMLS